MAVIQRSTSIDIAAASRLQIPMRSRTSGMEEGQIPQIDTSHARLGESGIPSTPSKSKPLKFRIKVQSSWRSLFLRTLATIRKRARSLITPARELADIPGTMASLRAIVSYSWLNVFLIFIPISWALHFAIPNQHVAVFFTCFVAIIPLAKLLALATDELSIRVGQTLAGLINATLGNIVEVLVAILALSHCELEIVQSSLIGSILSNLLLVLGMCFFFGGTRFSEQGFAAVPAQTNSSLLALSVVAVILPAAYQLIQKTSGTGADDSEAQAQVQEQILKFSHGIALIMLFIYGCYMVFQLGSHKQLYADDAANIAQSTAYARSKSTVNAEAAPRSSNERDEVPLRIFTSSPNSTTVLVDEPAVMDDDAQAEADDGLEHPQLNGYVCTALLLVVTALVGVTANFLVGSIDGLTTSTHGVISKEFVGIVLLPIVGNAAEHASAVTVSVKDKLTLSMSVAVGSSIQIALFVIPLIVVIGWGMGKPMTLLFDPFEAVCLLLAVLTVNYAVQDGKSNWLEGMILMCLYAILATLFFFYPGIPSPEHFAICT